MKSASEELIDTITEIIFQNHAVVEKYEMKSLVRRIAYIADCLESGQWTKEQAVSELRNISAE